MLIAQLSDLHVCAEGLLYKGVADSNSHLREAITHLHSLDRRPDLVLITGDLTDEGRVEEYAQALHLLQSLTIPYLVIPGNHDHREHLRHALRGSEHNNHGYLPRAGPLNYVVDDFPVRIVALDCCVNGKHHGEVDVAGLEWLAQTLRAERRKPTLILMHHPPFRSGIPYLDDYRYSDPKALAKIVSEATNVEAVLVGHVHRTMSHRWAGTLVMSCPSTTTEIALQMHPEASPKSYLGPRACLLHYWQEGQGLVSHVSFIDKYPGPFDFF